MMELTGIDETNRSWFEPLLFLDGADPDEIQILAGMIEDGSPAAAAALGVDKSRRIGRILSIYTRPDLRRRKAASRLMEALDTLARQYDLSRLECFYTDSMTGLDPFLRARGFTTYGEKQVESYRLADLLASKKIRIRMEEAASVVVKSLGQLEQEQRTLLSRMLEQEEYGSLPADLDEELSLAAFADGEPYALILSSVGEDERPRVLVRLLASFVYSVSAAMSLMTEWLSMVSARFGTEADISFYAVNPGVSSFLEALELPPPRLEERVRYAEKLCL